MTSGATLTVLFSSAVLLIPSLVSSYSTRLERTNKSNRTRSTFANTFISTVLPAGSSACPGVGWPDLTSHLVSGSLS